MILDCSSLREATEGCRLVLLAATESEAEPVLRALGAAERMEVATKQVYVGALPCGKAGRLKVALGISGCDKVNAAVLLGALLQAMAPELVLQFGIAGAFPGVGAGAVGDGALAYSDDPAHVGDLVVATQEAYSDTGSSSPSGWLSADDLSLAIAEINGAESGGVFPIGADLVEWALGSLLEAWEGEASVSKASTGDESEAPRVLGGPCVTSSMITGKDDEAQRIVERWGALAESMEGAAAAHVCALYGVPFLEIRAISNLVGDRDRETWEIERAVALVGKAVMSLADAFADREAD